MRRRLLISTLLTSLMLFASLVTTGITLASPSPLVSGASDHQWPYRPCPQAKHPSPVISCDVMVKGRVPAPHTNGARASQPNGTPPYTPYNLHYAYNLPYGTYSLQTIAIVVAYDDPNAETDLANYRYTFGLPPCTTANGCFRKVNQYGGSAPLPAPSSSWSAETSLDLDMVSAICFNCHILLVEANSPSSDALGTSVNSAVALGATQVSNSYGTNGEFSSEAYYCNAYYNHPGVAITASTGDNGPSVNFPAVCPNVIAVGGTSLYSNGAEVAWGGSGGGCSSFIGKPSWQNYTYTGCPNRAVADVSALADPYTGVYVYDTYGAYGWYQMGGTSASAPIIAATYALTGHAASFSYPGIIPWYYDAVYSCLNDVPNDTVEYAYQTGLGTPNNTTCF